MRTKTKTKTTKSRPVLVTTVHRGVFFGYATTTKGDVIRLDRARLCLYWSADVKGFMGLAATGPSATCRIGPPAKIELRGITCVAEVEPAAVTAWEAAPWRRRNGDRMTEPAYTLDLATIERLLAEATPGPWVAASRWSGGAERQVLSIPEDPAAPCLTVALAESVRSVADAALIAALVSAAPALLAAARERDAAEESSASAADRAMRYCIERDAAIAERDAACRVRDAAIAERDALAVEAGALRSQLAHRTNRGPA